MIEVDEVRRQSVLLMLHGLADAARRGGSSHGRRCDVCADSCMQRPLLVHHE